MTLTEEAQQGIMPNNIPIDIIYEDDDLIVLNKSSNMTVHPGAGNHNDTLVNALLYHTNCLSDIGGEIRPGIVHRLDKDTSGLMVIAKNNQAHAHLANQIETRELIRQYKALVWGMIKPIEGVINIPMDRNRLDRKKMSTVKTGGKKAITNYKTVEILHGGLFTLVECKLDTGRTHQIRVHLSHIGHSIVGDQTYGNNRRKIQGCPDLLKDVLYAMNRQALHSFYISFIHPRNGNRMDFKTELPKEYEELVEFIRKAS
jgi:23S rRNA pseudouridine1911/1915/1917 synthase